MWSRLSFVSCACNGLVLMDESLQLLPVVQTLDLSRNSFAKVDNLRNCTKLRHLDLGFNHLRTIASLSEVWLDLFCCFYNYFCVEKYLWKLSFFKFLIVIHLFSICSARSERRVLVLFFVRTIKWDFEQGIKTQ